MAICSASQVLAQSFTYTNTVDAPLNETAAPCSNPLDVNFTVNDAFIISDVDLGVLVTHSYRGDLVMTLEHPDGTRVRLVNGSGSIGGDNFNVRLNDEGTQTVNTDGNNANHSTSLTGSGGFQHNFIPNNPLSAFDGKASNGTWTLELCDQFAQDSGTFRHAVLYLTSAGALTDFADLSLTKTVSSPSPANFASITYTLTVTNNAASDRTTGATVLDLLPAGAQYVSHSGYGSYNPATGLWTLPSIAPGQSRQLLIQAVVNASAGATVANIAEIISADENDPDSTPGNGIVTEDDYAIASFTVGGSRVAGVAPVLSCPNGSLPFAWSPGDWGAGNSSSLVTVPGMGPVNWNLALPAGASWLSIPAYGGVHPRLTTAAQGVLSLSVAVEFTAIAQLATITIDLGEVTDGVQFTIFDVDYAPNDFADYIRVTGQRGGAPSANPVLTNGISNYVIGNQAFGDATSGDAQANGNVVVTFTDAVDTIIIEYGNHSLAPSDPDGQAIQFPGLFTFCQPVADLLVTKSSTIISDGLTGGSDDPFAIPGAVLRYCIQITNAGSATARDITASDTLPASVVYNPDTLLSGATCSTASVPEDADATGADELDPIGASFAAGEIGMTVAELADGDTAAITFEVTVQ